MAPRLASIVGEGRGKHGGERDQRGGGSRADPCPREKRGGGLGWYRTPPPESLDDLNDLDGARGEGWRWERNADPVGGRNPSKPYALLLVVALGIMSEHWAALPREVEGQRRGADLLLHPLRPTPRPASRNRGEFSSVSPEGGGGVQLLTIFRWVGVDCPLPPTPACPLGALHAGLQHQHAEAHLADRGTGGRTERPAGESMHEGGGHDAD